MKRYFSKVTADHWSAKNKLQQEAKEIARDMECRIIPADKLLDFKAEFIDRIARSNEKYNRCNPLHLSIWDREHDGNHIQFHISEVFSLSLYRAKD